MLRLRLTIIFTVVLTAQSSPLWAQCQSYSLAFGSQQSGTLDASDCNPVSSSTTLLSGPGEYWTMQLNAGDQVVITIQSLTLAIDFVVESPQGYMVASGTDVSRRGRVTGSFRAMTTGTYRALVRSQTSVAPACCGLFTIAADVDSLCPGTPLYWAREEAADLLASDGENCRPNYPFPHDIWALQLNAGDYAVVTVRSHASRQPYVLAFYPSGGGMGGDEDPNPYQEVRSANGEARLAFRAPDAGTYRVVVASDRPSDLGPYAIRLDRVTTPIVSGFFYSVLGNRVGISWLPALSPTPILEYLLVAGSAPGREDLARLPVGGVTQILAQAPRGIYYIRIRAHNEAGFADSPEQAIVVGPHLSSPGELLITSIVGQRVTLSWSPPATPGAAAYQLVVGTVPGGSDLGAVDVGNVLTVTVDQVPPGTYYVRVRAVNAEGPGAQSNEVVVTVF